MTTARFHLTFSSHHASQPIVHHLGRAFEVVTNIRRANIEERGGWLIVELNGPQERIDDAVAWLLEQGLKVDRIEA